MNENKIFTVIILSYNNLEYIEECLQSVLNQDYKYIEIIVSDDCSDNLDMIKIEKYINDNKKDNIVNFIINRNEKNLGIVRNLNKAIKLSTGDYFMNIACDDKIYDKNVISDIVTFFEKTGRLAITGFIEWCNEKMEKLNRDYPSKYAMEYVNSKTPSEVYKKLCEGNFLAGPGFSYSRELISLYGYYDEEYKFIEDYSRYLYLTRNGCCIGFMDRIIISYRVGGISTSPGNIDKEMEIRNQFNKDIDLIRVKEILPYTEN